MLVDKRDLARDVGGLGRRAAGEGVYIIVLGNLKLEKVSLRSDEAVEEYRSLLD